MATYPNPFTSQYTSKYQGGYTDVSLASGVYKVFGCSILGCNLNLGFNNNASTLDITLVEDTQNFDSFTYPTIPSVVGFSLPKGGVGQPIFYPTVVGGSSGVISSGLIQPSGYYSNNVPFYFAGIVTKYDRVAVDAGGKQFSVRVSDPREILGGIQVIIGGFGLSQSFEDVQSDPGITRTDGAGNVIDAFGYWDNGLESARNANGMVWNDIKEAIEACRVKIYEMEFEFLFTGDAFTNAPDWYRVSGEIMDMNTLLTRVANDAGSDFIVLTRKMNEGTTRGTAIIEIRGIKRTATNRLTSTEINNFLTSHDGLVKHCDISREFRNEDNSKVIVGGFRNKNYIAYPAPYASGIHGETTPTGFAENYYKWPASPLFRYFEDAVDASGVTTSIYNGAIFPFWGFAPTPFGDEPGQTPMAEPFLSLDHMAFDLDQPLYFLDPSGSLPSGVNYTMQVSGILPRIPTVRIDHVSYPVRQIAYIQSGSGTYDTYADCFLDGDGDSDFRPWAIVGTDPTFDPSIPLPPNYVRGLPLNTEVLKASLISAHLFFKMYSLHYPDVAEMLGFPTINFSAMKDYLTANPLEYPGNINLAVFYRIYGSDLTADSNGKFTAEKLIKANFETRMLAVLRDYLFQAVRNYAEEYMGKQFLVCLPRSEIMHRLWANPNDPYLPTNKDKPEIEYVVDGQGYFEVLPPAFDGLANPQGSGQLTLEQELQMIKRFQMEDGRFVPMTFFDWKPYGNGSFNSNGTNKLMFQDIPSSEYRPNRIADGNPAYIGMSCNVQQLVKRPDLALVTLPTALWFDPTEWKPEDDEDFVKSITDRAMRRFFAAWFSMDDDCKDIFGNDVDYFNDTVEKYWIPQLKTILKDAKDYQMATEPCLDPKAISIPLTSTWVTYGPWYYTSADLTGRIGIEVHDELVPWNFDRPTSPDPWYQNLDDAGFEMLERTRADLEYIDSATITVAGLPEFGIGDTLTSGKLSNMTGISVAFGIGEISTTYDMGTYIGRPGTYRKADYDNVAKFRVPKVPDINDRTQNISLFQYVYRDDARPRNQFRI